MLFQPLRVYEGVWRGPQPQCAADWTTLKNLGVRYSLDLQSGAEFFDDGSPLSEELQSETYGIRSYSHPLGWILPPSKKELREARNFITSNKPVYVHCKSGVDRTGMVIAALTSSDRDPDTKRAAIAEMKKQGMHWWYYWWAWFL